MSIQRFRGNIRKLFWFPGVVLLIGTAFAQTQPGANPQQGQNPSTLPNPSPGTPPGGLPPTPDQLNNSQSFYDQNFVRDALEGAMAEVQLGQIAAQKGSSEDVKTFGQKMVDDHTKLQNQMLEVAHQMGVKPPAGPSKKDKKLAAKLEGLSGTQFDDAYIKAMVKDHKKDLDSFKTEADKAQVPAVKQVAQEGAPVIASHLQMIQKIAQDHNVKGE
jgi:putative membrane protein